MIYDDDDDDDDDVKCGFVLGSLCQEGWEAERTDFESRNFVHLASYWLPALFHFWKSVEDYGAPGMR